MQGEVSVVVDEVEAQHFLPISILVVLVELKGGVIQR